jgi:hypothetical protein
MKLGTHRFQRAVSDSRALGGEIALGSGHGCLRAIIGRSKQYGSGAQRFQSMRLSPRLHAGSDAHPGRAQKLDGHPIGGQGSRVEDRMDDAIFDLLSSILNPRSSYPYGVVILTSSTPASTRLAPLASAAWMRIRIVRPANWLRFTVAVAHAALS